MEDGEERFRILPQETDVPGGEKVESEDRHSHQTRDRRTAPN